MSRSYLEGFKRYYQSMFGDVDGKVFHQPLHLTTYTTFDNMAAQVYFAIYRHNERIELSANVIFEINGSRKSIGLTVVSDRYYAFDWYGESGRLFLCWVT